mgnify:CR=1 FL=1
MAKYKNGENRMSGSNGCKILVTALVVAVIMGGLGFVSGFLTHTVLVADERTGVEVLPLSLIHISEPTRPY